MYVSYVHTISPPPTYTSPPTVTHTARNGKVSKLEQVYLRGSHLKFVVLPEILKNAPVFKKVSRLWMERGMDRPVVGLDWILDRIGSDWIGLY